MDRAKAAQFQGFEIVVLAREGQYAQRIKDAGFRFVGLNMERSSTHLWKEWPDFASAATSSRPMMPLASVMGIHVRTIRLLPGSGH